MAEKQDEEKPKKAQKIGNKKLLQVTIVSADLGQDFKLGIERFFDKADPQIKCDFMEKSYFSAAASNTLKPCYLTKFSVILDEKQLYSKEDLNSERMYLTFTLIEKELLLQDKLMCRTTKHLHSFIAFGEERKKLHTIKLYDVPKDQDQESFKKYKKANEKYRKTAKKDETGIVRDGEDTSGRKAVASLQLDFELFDIEPHTNL